MKGASIVSPWRNDFPVICGAKVPAPVYLDSAATALKPISVMESVRRVYGECTANVGRSAHGMATELTADFERVRSEVAAFIGAQSRQIVFTSGATAGVNLVAASLGLERNDRVITSEFEHHSNLLPWRQRCRTVEVPLFGPEATKVELHRELKAGARIVAVNAVSNVSGEVLDLASVCGVAKIYRVPVFLDAAQAIVHEPINVESTGCDYLVFSGHKMLGPFGVGVLYVREPDALLERTAWSGGGTVEFSRSGALIHRAAPWGLEPGTPNVAGVLGLGSALRYIRRAGVETVRQHLSELNRYAHDRLADSSLVRLVFEHGPNHAPIFTFNVGLTKLTPHRISELLSGLHDLAVGSGTFCCPHGLRRGGVEAGLRASLHLYNDSSDVDRLLVALDRLGPLLER